MARRSLGFGIVRSVEPSHGRARLAELCALLSDELGSLFIPDHPTSYGELVERCERGELDLAWVPPIATAKLQAKGEMSVLALPVRRGAISYRAALVTREDGPASLADLRGSSIGWVDRESCSGYVMPRLFLAASSLDVKCLFSRETFFGSHSAVVDAVVSKRVQVGATFCSAEALSDRSLPSPSIRAPPPVGGSQAQSGTLPPAPLGAGPSWSGPDGKASVPLRVLAASAPIPNDALVVSFQVPADMRSKLLRWFLDLRDARARQLCSELFGAGGFRVATPEHFSALQQMMRAARAHGDVA